MRVNKRVNKQGEKPVELPNLQNDENPDASTKSQIWKVP